ncbi:adenosylmethionine--8-amino-7-oxononanoate transaminase [Sphingorhabdus sp. Alg239-R122]|uniref:adenosylmethionine--8-amino-7-oxononanoate transaminase n=1 Tax=Sphingorhabdus sp. Alg239-R122 TaxID=2305989 RepID=UPI0013DA6B07|nr:adenosylmethionine--8-amino-7-oxononanoate transaminase [Sphingorhabdus sp. Alg239-R122]
MSAAIWHPFTQHGLKEPIPQIVHGDGARLYTDDGREIIDAISSWWVNTHGHCHPRIMAAIQAQADRLDQVIFAGWTHEPAERLADALSHVLPTPLSHIFFSDSGSTAVEVALKMALGYWHNCGEKRDRIIVMENSYHGDTVGTMSVGARGVFNRPYAPLLFDVSSIPFPAAGQEQAMLDKLESLCALKPAAFIVEPLVLGAGGMLMYGPDMLARMHAICAAHDVLFIADEVMTGWGRTGTVFACEQAGIVPDISCLSKGLTGGAIPLAVTAAQKRIYDAHYSRDKADMFFHSSSYTANPLACGAALANLAIWRDEPVQVRIDTIIAAHREFAKQMTPHIGRDNIRQTGTILALDFVRGQGESASYMSALGPELLAFFAARDVLLRPLGNTVYIMPPYCITEVELARIYDAVKAAAERFLQ